MKKSCRVQYIIPFIYFNKYFICALKSRKIYTKLLLFLIARGQNYKRALLFKNIFVVIECFVTRIILIVNTNNKNIYILEKIYLPQMTLVILERSRMLENGIFSPPELNFCTYVCIS